MNKKTNARPFSLALLLVVFCSQSLVAQVTSKLIYPGKDGKLVYKPYTNEGDILPDFSYCGYMGGGVAIPDVPVKITLEPGDFSKDDVPRIQEAIDKVGKMPQDAKGFRGAVLLKKGRYNVRNTIYLRHSGVVLKGEGDNEKGSVLVCTKKEAYDLIIVGTSASSVKDEKSQQQITDKYVPSGVRKFTVSNAKMFQVGDNVIVERPSTAKWISYIGMDKIPARWVPVEGLSQGKISQLRQQGLLNADETQYDGTLQWTSGSKDLSFRRVITAIKGNEITVDIPLTNAFQQEFGGGVVYKYKYDDGYLTEQAGVEYLRAESYYDPKVTKNDRSIGKYCADEKHAQRFVTFNTSKNVWARNLTTLYMGHGYATRKECTYCTIQDCQFLDPIAWIKGGRRYGYGIGGQMCLVQRNYSRNARHDLAFSASVPGPNAYVDNWGDMGFTGVETHQRWAAGGLFDNCSYQGPGSHLNSVNRGSAGTGHGWTGAQIVFWNCKSRYTLVMKPPTAQNFSIGNYGKSYSDNKEWITPEAIQAGIDYINGTSGNNFRYEGIPVVGDGYIESPIAYVSPQYLYYKQLWDRKGEEAVKQVTTVKQQQLIFEK